MKLFLSIFMAFTFIACDEMELDNNYRGRPPIEPCSNKSSCLPDLPEWLIVISKDNLPSNLMLKINGIEVFNECKNQEFPFNITRGEANSNLSSEDFQDPGITALNLKIYNFDSNCLDSTLYYSNDNQVFKRFERTDADLIRIEITN